MQTVLPGGLEGGPLPADTSPLQARVDAAPPGATLRIGPGTYEGDLVIEHAVHLIGEGRPRLLGSGKGSVVRIRAPGVILEGFDLDGRAGGDLGRDSSGVHVAAAQVVVRDVRISNTLFGVYLREANGARIERSTIVGIAAKESGEKGSGVHVWNTDGFVLVGNTIVDARDGLYIQSSPHGVIRGNTVRYVRYGIHYMYSDDNIFEDNLFESSAAGGVLMYSRRLVFRRNQFLHNRGFASVGLLFKACDDSVAEDNLIADNARGIFLESSFGNVIRRNVIAESDTALVLYDSCGGNRIEGNAFIANLTPLTLVGRRTDTRLDGNYWSDNDEPDLDGDGYSDRPHALASLFDHLRGNLTAADLVAQSPAAEALSAAERGFPVLRPGEVSDHRPLVRPPDLAGVPRPHLRARAVNVAGIACSLVAVALALIAVLGIGLRHRRGSP